MNYGYTRTGITRHINSSSQISYCGRDIVKASVNPYMDGKHYLTCMLCAGRQLRKAEISKTRNKDTIPLRLRKFL